MQQPDTHKRTPVSPIWFLPLLALGIGAWLLYTSYRDAGIDITIHFESAEGIMPGKTKVIFKGIPVGTVQQVTVDPDLQGVTLQVEMEKQTRPGLVEDTLFWIVKPEVTAGRITGLETLLSGSYIGVRKGKSTVPSRNFQGLASPPPLVDDTPGLHVVLKTNQLYSLQRGSYLYNKNIKIGLVDDYHLNKDGSINIDLLIQPKYSHLIRESTRFWNASGLSISGDLQAGLSINIESLASLIYGGLTCATPKELTTSPAVKNGHVFHLYKDFEDARYGISATLQLASGEDIVAGKTRIMYRGLKIGVVRSLKINPDQYHTVTATLLLDPRAKQVLRQHTRFWVVRPQVSIEGIKHLNTLVSGAFITLQIGDGAYCDHFIVHPTPLPQASVRAGTHYRLIAPDSGSLTIGTPILYKKRKVGEITKIDLSKDGKKVVTEILIYKPYSSFVREDAVFWNVSGIEAGGSLANFQINLASLRTMLAGGLTFINPLSERLKKPRPVAAAGHTFTLYASRGDATRKVMAMRRPGIILHLEVETMSSISAGVPVLFHKIPVGEVIDFHLNPKDKKIEGDILLYKEFTKLVNATTRFYDASGVRMRASLKEVSLELESIDSLIGGGISFLTPGKGKPVHSGQVFHLYGSREEARMADGRLLTLVFSDGTGLRTGTEIRYRGVTLGRLVRVWFDPAKDKVMGRAAVEKGSAALFNTNTLLWLVHPRVDLTGISNLETLVFGPYIDIMPGPGKPCSTFTVADVPPTAPLLYPGLNIILETTTRGSVKVGNPVMYRQVRVGQVTAVTLSPTGQQVWIHANIEPRFRKLVHAHSRFWNISGIRINGGLFSGITVQTASMETLLAGGIAFATPEKDNMGKPAVNGDHFILAPKADQAWKQWAPKFQLQTN